MAALQNAVIALGLSRVASRRRRPNRAPQTSANTRICASTLRASALKA